MASFDGPSTVVVLFSYGGIHPATSMCLLNDACRCSFQAAVAIQRNEFLKSLGLPPAHKHWEMTVAPAPQDALISRGRGIAAKRFLQDSKADVLIMIDHDIEWRTSSSDYCGDLLYLARKCHEVQGIVGAAVSKKTRGEGIASMWKKGGTVNMGTDALEPAWFVGGAFTAYPRKALQAVSDDMEEIIPGFRPIFGEMTVEHPNEKDKKIHLSEDWAFCARAREKGYESYIALLPDCKHHGSYAYTVMESQPPAVTINNECVPTEKKDVNTNGKKKIKISCLHATRGRPQKALSTKQKWMDAASGKYEIEYIISQDTDDDNSIESVDGMNVKAVYGQSRGCVDAFNRALYNSTGDICIQLMDDLDNPPKDWDELIANELGPFIDEPKLLKVSDGTNLNPEKPWLLTITIGTRAWFKKAGYFWYPGYVSVFCDDDISLKALNENAVIDASDKITIPHNWKADGDDKTYQDSYKSENWRIGHEVLEKRKRDGFPDRPELWQ